MALTYLTVAQMKQRAGSSELAGLLNLSGDALDTELDSIIEKAEGMVNGYLQVNYTTPLTGSAGLKMARDWTFHLANHDANARGRGTEVREVVKRLYENTMRELRDVQAGKMMIPDEVAAKEAGRSFDTASNSILFDWDDGAEGTF